MTPLSFLKAALTAGALALTAAAPATAQDPAAVQPDGSRASVEIAIDGFTTDRGRVVARASGRFGFRDGGSFARSAQRRVRLSVSTGGSCRVLTLSLADLRLNLLGLLVNTSAVNLRITGEDDAVLGRLFCRLARSIRLGDAVSQAAIARSLNRRVRRKPMRVLRLSAAVIPQEAKAAQSEPQPGQPAPAAPRCLVLDLVLGPLDLNLLGLVVELFGEDRRKPVRVLVEADPNGGVLGSTFCRLAGGQPPA